MTVAQLQKLAGQLTEWQEKLEDKLGNASDAWLQSEKADWTEELVGLIEETQSSIENLVEHLESRL